MIIKVRNLLDETAQTTYLTQLESLGTTTLHVQNANGFGAASWAVQIGKTGEEKAEVCIVDSTAPAGTTLTLATATKADHSTDTPVYATKWNKLIFKRSTTGTSGSAVAWTSSTVNIQPDATFTQIDDTSGAATYAYKASYYNSILDTESTDSDWIVPAGYDFYSLAKIRSRIKHKLFSTNFIGDDDVIDEWINEYLELMTNAAIKVNQDFNIGTCEVAYSGTSDLGTITAADYKKAVRVWIKTEGTAYFEARKMWLNSFKPNQIFNNTLPYFFMQGDNIIGRRPNDTAGTALVYYAKLNPVLDSDGDLLPLPFRGYTSGFVNYALAQALYKDNKPQDAQLREAYANKAITDFVNEMTPRNMTGESYINIVEQVGDNYDPFI